MVDFFDAENLWPWHALSPIPSADTANANTENVTTSAVIITPGADVRTITVVSDKNCRINPRGGAAVDNDTCTLVYANDHTTITVTPGVAVYALSLSGTAVITATPMVRLRMSGKVLGAHIDSTGKITVNAIMLMPTYSSFDVFVTMKANGWSTGTPDVVSLNSALFSSNYMAGKGQPFGVSPANDFCFLNNLFGRGNLVNGVDFYCRMTALQTTFPAGALMEWSWPSSGGVGIGAFCYGYPEIVFGDGRFGNPFNTVGPWSLPQRINQCATLKMSCNIAIGGNPESYDVLLDSCVTASSSSTDGAYVMELSFFLHTNTNMIFVGSPSILHEFSWGWAKVGLQGQQACFMPCNADGTQHRDILLATDIDLMECFVYAIGMGWITGNEYLRGCEFGAEMQVPTALNSAPYTGSLLVHSLSYNWPATLAAPAYATSLIKAPTISGNTAVGSTLTCVTGKWSGYPVPTKTFQWQRAGVDRAGATAATYVTVAGDVGNAMTCKETATNAGGSANASSNAIIPV